MILDVWVCYWKRRGDAKYSDIQEVLDSEEKAIAWVQETKKNFESSLSSAYWLPITVKMTVH